MEVEQEIMWCQNRRGACKRTEDIVCAEKPEDVQDLIMRLDDAGKADFIVRINVGKTKYNKNNVRNCVANIKVDKGMYRIPTHKVLTPGEQNNSI